MKISKDIKYIGVNDHEVDLFEGQYKVPNGMSYNSYIIDDEKIAVMDTVDIRFASEWLDNLMTCLEDRIPDYLIVQHMEPDHSSVIYNFCQMYPDAKIVASGKAFEMMGNYFGTEFDDRQIVVSDKDTLVLGQHTLEFLTAPMVHWPEVIMTYDRTDKVLFSADAFGKFGANDEPGEWESEAARYYFGIVAPYGSEVKNLLIKVSKKYINTICPLHGPILDENLDYYVGLYDKWSGYESDKEGILICYTSAYGHTKSAVIQFRDLLKSYGCPDVVIRDVARDDMAECVKDAFRYEKVVFATTTYNADIFPFMRDFLTRLVKRKFQNKTVGFIGNGSWAPQAVKIMKSMLDESEKITFCKTEAEFLSSADHEDFEVLKKLATELCSEYIAIDSATADKQNMKALQNIGYGLYLITSFDGVKDNGMIANSVVQVTNSPVKIAVTINKQCKTHETVLATGVMNVCAITEDTGFEFFERFGLISGRVKDKINRKEVCHSENGLVFPKKGINSFMSLKTDRYIDLGTHGMFICDVEEARVLNDKPTMTYSYYFENVKPKPETKDKKGFVCKVCGHVYEGDELPEDYICPICGHSAVDFEPI